MSQTTTATRSAIRPVDRVFAAIDTPDIAGAARLVEALRGEVGGIKVGNELFTAQGPEGVRVLAGAARLFLDLKFHDIPNTVAGAVRSATRLRPFCLTLHASGGRAMMQAAAEAAREAAIARGRAALQAGRSVVVYSALGRDGGFVETRGAEAIGFNRNLGEQLGEILRVLVTQEKLTRALVAGGDTSSHAARQLGLSALTLATPIAPGSPRCRGHAPGGALDGLEIALKGGQVGGVTYFRQVLDGTT